MAARRFTPYEYLDSSVAKAGALRLTTECLRGRFQPNMHYCSALCLSAVHDCAALALKPHRRTFCGMARIMQFASTPLGKLRPHPTFNHQGACMKLVSAVIKPFKLDEVREALSTIGVQG